MALERPLKPMKDAEGHVDVGNVMRQHRYVIHCSNRRYVLKEKEHWPEEKLPPVVFYPREFIEIMSQNQDGVLDSLGLASDQKDNITKWQKILGKTSISVKERDDLMWSMRRNLRDCPQSQKIPGEFREDNRTREERIADAFLKENAQRHSAGDKIPFSLRLCRAVCDPEFLDKTGVDGEGKAKILKFRDRIMAPSFNPSDPNCAKTLEFLSNTMGGRLRKCPLMESRAKAVPGRERQFVSPLSSMKSIWREFGIEMNEMFSWLRVSHSDDKRPPIWSESLLRTVFDDGILGKLGCDLPAAPEKGQEKKTPGAYIASWKKTVEDCPEGKLEDTILSFSDKQISSLYSCLGLHVKPLFDRYRKSHPQEFPENPEAAKWRTRSGR